MLITAFVQFRHEAHWEPRNAFILKRGTNWNELELPETSWNHLERTGTTWNELEPSGTNWTQPKN